MSGVSRGGERTYKRRWTRLHTEANAFTRGSEHVRSHLRMRLSPPVKRARYTLHLSGTICKSYTIGSCFNYCQCFLVHTVFQLLYILLETWGITIMYKYVLYSICLWNLQLKFNCPCTFTLFCLVSVTCGARWSWSDVGKRVCWKCGRNFECFLQRREFITSTNDAVFRLVGMHSIQEFRRNLEWCERERDMDPVFSSPLCILYPISFSEGN